MYALGVNAINRHGDVRDIIFDQTQQAEQDQFGCKYDEMKVLGEDEDVFDMSKDDGPKPPFLEYCDKPELVETLCLGERITLNVNNCCYNLVRPGYTVVLYGPRRSGKTKLLMNICQRIRPYYKEVIVFTKTKASGEYHKILPYAHVIEGLDEEILQALIDMQKGRKKADTRGEEMGNYNMLIILDDVMSEKLRYKKRLDSVFFEGRHYNITLFVLVQDVKGIGPATSVNTDLAFSFALPDRRSRDTIREKFCDYLDRDEFDALMDSELVNRKYQVICFDVAHRYNPLDYRLYVGCVDPSQEIPFVMGAKDMWLESFQQLCDLGLEHLLVKNDWGIIE